MPLLVWEEFNAGLAHAFSEPGIVLALLALACLIGQSWPSRSRAILGAYAFATVAGVAAARMGLPIGAPAGLLAVALAAAIFAAAIPSGAAKVAAALAAAGGLLTGAASTPVLLPLRASLPTIAGALLGAVIALALLSYAAGNFRRRFGGEKGWIGLRIAASWIAAIAVMMLALHLGQGA